MVRTASVGQTKLRKVFLVPKPKVCDQDSPSFLRIPANLCDRDRYGSVYGAVADHAPVSPDSNPSEKMSQLAVKK